MFQPAFGSSLFRVFSTPSGRSGRMCLIAAFTSLKLFNTPGDGLLALSFLPPRELDLVLVDLVRGTRRRLLVGVVVVVLSQ